MTSNYPEKFRATPAAWARYNRRFGSATGLWNARRIDHDEWDRRTEDAFRQLVEDPETEVLVPAPATGCTACDTGLRIRHADFCSKAVRS